MKIRTLLDSIIKKGDEIQVNFFSFHHANSNLLILSMEKSKN